jgi:hypothetical protein
MEVHTNPPSILVSADVPPACAGVFYRAEQAIGLIGSGRLSVGQRILALIAIGWLPPYLLTALLNRGELRSFFMDGRADMRMLIAVPALLIGEIMIASQIASVASYIRQGDLLSVADMAYADNLIALTERLRSAVIPQLVILVLVITRITVSYRGLVNTAGWMGEQVGDSFRLSAAGWWALLVSAPLWNFLLSMLLWSWLLWAFFLFKLSRRDLRLVASHPDKHGGLAFLGLTASGFAPIAFAVCISIAATWRHAIVHQGAHLSDFKFDAIVLVAGVALISGAPLMFFAPRLVSLRFHGMSDYGVLGQVLSAKFHDAWILSRTQQNPKTLQTPESSALNSYGKTYDNVGEIKMFPADVSSFYPLAAAVIIPGIFVATAQLPLMVILKDLIRAIH